MTAIYNMLFLLQARIVKSMRGENMDEEIFRQYFIRLFRGIRTMEQKFKDLMDPEEDANFIRFSRAIGEMADTFKISRTEKSMDSREKTELTKKSNHKRYQQDMTKVIFGIGAVPAESKNKSHELRIVPSKILGFSKVQLTTVSSSRKKGLRPNQDIIENMKKYQSDAEQSEDQVESPASLPEPGMTKQTSALSPKGQVSLP